MKKTDKLKLPIYEEADAPDLIQGYNAAMEILDGAGPDIDFPISVEQGGTGTTDGVPTEENPGLVPALPERNDYHLKSDGTWGIGPWTTANYTSQQLVGGPPFIQSGDGYYFLSGYKGPNGGLTTYWLDMAKAIYGQNGQTGDTRYSFPGLVPPNTNTNRTNQYLAGDGMWKDSLTLPETSNSTYGIGGVITGNGTGYNSYIRGYVVNSSGTKQEILYDDSKITYGKTISYGTPNMYTPGLVPKCEVINGSQKVLHGDGTWGEIDIPEVTTDTITGILPKEKGGTGNSTGNAASADKLSSAKNISVKNGNAAAASASFDGSKDITISLSALDASTLTTGTVPLERLPQGALERIVDVEDQAARFALNTSKVQLGDTVRQLDTGIMYVVVDESHLSDQWGYIEYTAGTAAKANSADTLTTSRNLGVNLENSSATGAAFNGGSNQLNIPVSGTLGIEHGGTGGTTAREAQYNLLSDIGEISSDTSDSSLFVMSYGSTTASKTAGKIATRTGTNVWNWIASKIRSIFGFSDANVLDAAHGGTGATTPDSAWTNLGGGSVGKLNTNGTATTYLNGAGQWTTPANTDTKVTQTVATDNVEYPLLAKNTNATATITDTSKFAAGVTINPSTKTITATTFKGALTGNVTGNVSGSSGSCTGNAATATTAGNVTGTVAIANGGTGKTDAASAWTALGGGSVGKLNTNASQTQYLRGDGTWQTPPDTKYNAVTTSTNGLMIAADKDKLDNTNIAYATCPTPAATAAKVATIVGNTNWSLQVGSIIGIKFTYTNTASNVTLNVNGTGPKQIWYAAAAYTSTSGTVCGTAGRTAFYMYDGTYWCWISHGSEDNTTYTNMSLGNGYAICNNNDGDSVLTATLANYNLLVGGTVSVKFNNTVSWQKNMTLNVNSKGAKPIKFYGMDIADFIESFKYLYGPLTGVDSEFIFSPGQLITFIYDGTNYQIISSSPEIFSIFSQYSLKATSAAYLDPDPDYLQMNRRSLGLGYTLGALPIANGGTGLTEVGTNGQVLTAKDGKAVWANASGGGIPILKPLDKDGNITDDLSKIGQISCQVVSSYFGIQIILPTFFNPEKEYMLQIMSNYTTLSTMSYIIYTPMFIEVESTYISTGNNPVICCFNANTQSSGATGVQSVTTTPIFQIQKNSNLTGGLFLYTQDTSLFKAYQNTEDEQGRGNVYFSILFMEIVRD